LNTFTEPKKINGKALGSLLIGLISIAGMLMVGEGTLLSIAGLIFGLIGLRETKLQQGGYLAAVLGIICNGIGIISLVL
jgi:hypothetical protein